MTRGKYGGIRIIGIIVTAVVADVAVDEVCAERDATCRPGVYWVKIKPHGIAFPNNTVSF